MINPIKRTRTVPLELLLPPCWLRIRETTSAPIEQAGHMLWQTGPQGLFLNELTNAIEQAKEVVCIAAFLLSDQQLAEAMLQATERGVRVYVLTASEARLAKQVGEDNDFDKRMLNEHKELLDNLAGKVELRSAEHFHAKFLITDPDNHPKGFISTANFNPALTKSVELGVSLEPEEVKELAAWFNHAFWMEAERELAEKGRLAQVTSSPHKPERPLQNNIFVTAQGEHGLKNIVLELINGATTNLIISSYGLELEHSVITAIEERALAGIPVTLLTRPRPAVLQACLRLEAVGVKILAHDKLHAKAIVSDAGALIMSANIGMHGLDEGFEVGLRLSAEKQRDLHRALKNWSEEFFPWEFSNKAPRISHLGEVCLADNGLRTGIRHVKHETVVELPKVTAPSVLDMETAPDPVFTEFDDKNIFYHQVRYEWEVCPPQLPKGASQRFKELEVKNTGRKGKKSKSKRKEPFNPPIYDHAGQVYVVLPNVDALTTTTAKAKELGARVVLS